ncbi:hypothetical protein [Allomuricauda sp. M10]|uniref:hypothetical protein n=1 Tax=Allomuricauda sp. M10 TaxID=2683292 RepID=UPI001D17FCA7|nr:hypothetical protein [Muricauda sp. M10]
MIYKVFEQDANTLLEKPETGIGYQIISAFQYERHIMRKFVVYNTNLAVELDSEFIYHKNQVVQRGYNLMLGKSDVIMLETNSIKVLKKIDVENKIDYTNNLNNKGRYSGGKGAIDNPEERSNGTESFVRISAYEDDRRVDMVNKKLKPGSFATTKVDYLKCVMLNDNPIDRYALPNDEEIKWAFHINPKLGDILQRGVVQPAFGHIGGGIEAYFKSGTSDGTLISKRPYGK